MKKFIMSCPFQPEGGLRRTKYEAAGNPALEYGETRFPVIPLINAYAGENEEVTLVLIESDNDNVAGNKKYLLEELEELKNNRNIKVSVKTVKTSYSEDINTQLQLYADIVSQISDGDELFACCTYGTKPTPIIQNMALNFAHRAMKDVSVGCIVYGQFDHILKKSCIFDITPLFCMENISNNLARLGVENPAEKIKEILEL